MMQPRVRFSCVVDQKPKYASQGRLFVQTLLEFAKRSPSEIIVHRVGEMEKRNREFYERLGVEVIQVERFDERHPHSNKLRQLESPALQDADSIVLCDCDLAFCEPVGETIGGDSVRAKPVDVANLALDQWRGIFKATGLPFPQRFTTSTFDSRPTLASYCNGGFLVLPRPVFQALREVWPRWNRFLLDRPALLDQFSFFTDQVSFLLALTELRIEVDPLPLEYNFPTHLKYRDDARAITPKILHYHDRVDASGLLLPTSVPSIDAQIERVNDFIRKTRRSAFDNFAFWEFRYAEHPDLGSGIGSRGEALTLKRQMLAREVAELGPDSVLDIGCGDLETARELPVSRYVGVDMSPTSIRIGAAKRPDWQFLCGDPSELPLDRADLVICLDVLIHQSEENYRRLCARLMELAGRHLVVSGYNQAPWLTSEIVFYHEPLSETLRRFGPGSLNIIGGYRDITVFRWTPSA